MLLRSLSKERGVRNVLCRIGVCVLGVLASGGVARAALDLKEYEVAPIVYDGPADSKITVSVSNQ
jgi:hypothetical protein